MLQMRKKLAVWRKNCRTLQEQNVKEKEIDNIKDEEIMKIEEKC